MPGAEEAPQDNQLADVVRRMIGGKDDFAVDGLAGAVRNGRKDVDVRIAHELGQRAAIVEKSLNGGVPSVAVLDAGTVWAISER